MRETAATASVLTRPTQNISARLYSVCNRLPRTNGHARWKSFGGIAPVVMSIRASSLPTEVQCRIHAVGAQRCSEVGDAAIVHAV